MKKLLLLISCFTIGYISAQETEQQETENQPVTTLKQDSTIVEKEISKTSITIKRKNDIMIAPIGAILGMGNVSYEHHLNENSGIGAHASFVFSKHISSLLFYKSWYVLPYYRYYFGKRWARGFFIDGFTGLVGTKVDVYYSHQYSSFLHYEKNITKFNVGVSIGGKWDTKNNIIFETSLGIGTTFQEEFPLFTKGMLGIGYRF